MQEEIISTNSNFVELVNHNQHTQLGGNNHRCLFLDTFYNQFLTDLYNSEPQLRNELFTHQLQRIINSHNGDSDFYSSGLKKFGWQADQIIINNPFMQSAWARENGVNAQGEMLILEQVSRIKPDVLYCQDMHAMSEPLLVELKKHCRLLVGQIATSIIHVPIHRYDVIISSILPIVEHCRSKGITSFYVPLAFSKRVGEKLNLPASYAQRSIDCSFVGSIASEIHLERTKLLDYLVGQVPIKFFGMGVDKLPQDSLIRANYQGQVWGADLFSVLGNSKITVNRHAEVWCDKDQSRNATDNFANNMRLFEATGMGALLLTEYRENLADLFEIGKEIVVYRSADECASLIKYYLTRPEKAQKIAEAGQARTLQDHSYFARMNDVSSYLKKLLRLQEEKHSAVDYQRISCDYKTVQTNEIKSQHTNAWQNSEMAVKQRALVHSELTQMYRGEVVLPFKSLSEVLSRVLYTNDKVLEIGCSSGYYYEVLTYLLARKFEYTGVDYSAPMIEMAKYYYPEVPFVTASGDDLPFKDKSFDLTLSGCVLLHCPNYKDHIKETVRVTSRSIVLTRTPITKRSETKYFTKKAYGVETVELCFNESEIVGLMREQGFNLTHYLVLDSDEVNDRHTITYAFARI